MPELLVRAGSIFLGCWESAWIIEDVEERLRHV